MVARVWLSPPLRKRLDDFDCLVAIFQDLDEGDIRHPFVWHYSSIRIILEFRTIPFIIILYPPFTPKDLRRQMHYFDGGLRPFNRDLLRIFHPHCLRLVVLVDGGWGGNDGVN